MKDCITAEEFYDLAKPRVLLDAELKVFKLCDFDCVIRN